MHERVQWIPWDREDDLISEAACHAFIRGAIFILLTAHRDDIANIG